MKVKVFLAVMTVVTISAAGASIYPTGDTEPFGPDISLTTGQVDGDSACGDVNGDGIAMSVGDLVYLVRYICGEVPLAAPWENSDVDYCGSINASDVGEYVSFFRFPIPEFWCNGAVNCSLPTGSNLITLGCPLDVAPPFPDSVPLPVYVTNDTSLSTLTLGFRTNSDDVRITSWDTTGTVLPEAMFVKMASPADTGYIWEDTDSNSVMIIASVSDWSTPTPCLPPQAGGLLGTFWLRITPGAQAQTIDIDTAFFPPAGEFIFVAEWSGAIVPGYEDCGAEDIILRDYICGDTDNSGVVNVSDVVFLIAFIFTGGAPPAGWNLTADVDCNEIINISDVVYLLQYIFDGGPGPCDACP